MIANDLPKNFGALKAKAEINREKYQRGRRIFRFQISDSRLDSLFNFPNSVITYPNKLENVGLSIVLFSVNNQN
jgi:hypothetical protein